MHRPDVVITFSDVQAEIAAALLRPRATVLATNQRTPVGIAATVRLVARAVGKGDAGEKLAADFERQLGELRRMPVRTPRVYFEEWPGPPICGIA